MEFDTAVSSAVDAGTLRLMLATERGAWFPVIQSTPLIMIAMVEDPTQVVTRTATKFMPFATP
jgi:hypothetical protein